MIPIVTPAEMAAIDAAAPEGADVLIGRAGWEAAVEARRLMGGTYGRRVLVAAGKGNNGADGKVAAAVLRRWGVRCRVVPPPVALELVAAGANERTRRWDLVIDAAYGTGLRGAWGADRPPAAPVLAVDIPSGIDALTGENHGCWPAAATVTFGALKPGLLLHPGAVAAGEVRVASIGLDISSAGAWLMSDTDAHAVPRGPEPTAHKWRRSVRVIAGSPQMRGAGHLVCAAAQQAGAGMVVISAPGVPAGQIARPTEAVAQELCSDDWAAPALEGIERFDAAVIGPGLGTDPQTLAQIAQFIAACGVPLVIDADALTAVAEHRKCLSDRSAPTVLTPHDGEFAKLMGGPPATDRFHAVRHAAGSLDSVVLLKGPTTLVAAPMGRERAAAPQEESAARVAHESSPPVIAVNSGTARLATAGSGDVLTGVIAAVLSCPAPTYDTARAVAAAAHWHGRTATASLEGGDVARPLTSLTAPAPLTPLTAMRQVELLAAARAGLADAGMNATGP